MLSFRSPGSVGRLPAFARTAFGIDVLGGKVVLLGPVVVPFALLEY